jgi:RNA polymerase sigma-70 factor (ECF subfamily)
MNPKSAGSELAGRGLDSQSQSSTSVLVERIKLGDDRATDRLFSRLVTRVRRWAHGRLPRRSRLGLETADVVQDAALRVWRHLDRIDVSESGNLEAYVRQAVRNRIRDEARSLTRRPEAHPLDSQIPSDAVSPLQQAIDRRAAEAYDAGLAKLAPQDREMLLARMEGYTYEQLVVLFGASSPDKARRMVLAAVDRLAGLLAEERGRA